MKNFLLIDDYDREILNSKIKYDQVDKQNILLKQELENKIRVNKTLTDSYNELKMSEEKLKLENEKFKRKMGKWILSLLNLQNI